MHTTVLVYLMAECDIAVAARYLQYRLRCIGCQIPQWDDLVKFVECLITGTNDDDIGALAVEADEGISATARRAQRFVREDSVREWVVKQNGCQQVLLGSKALMEKFDHVADQQNGVPDSSERRQYGSITNRTFCHGFRKRRGIVLARSASEKPDDRTTLREKAIA